MHALQIESGVVLHGWRPATRTHAFQQPLGGTFGQYSKYAALMERCWAENPQARPTFSQVSMICGPTAACMARRSSGDGCHLVQCRISIA